MEALNRKYNFINNCGNLVISNQWFDSVSDFHNGIAGARIDNTKYAIDINGKIVKVTFDNAQSLLNKGYKPDEIFNYVSSNFSDDYAKVRLNTKYNWIRENNRLVSPNQWFDDADIFIKGYSRIVLNNKFNFIDINGKYISEQWFDWVDIFYRDYAMVSLNGKYNYINDDGRLVSPNQWFDNIYNFNENGYARVELNGKWNFINTNGKIVSPNQWFDDAEHFIDRYAKVKLNGNSYVINTDGQLYDEETMKPIKVPVKI